MSTQSHVAPTMVTLAFVACASVCGANTIHVPGDQPTIQFGINAASAGDTIQVASGVYTESLFLTGVPVVLLGDTVGLSVVLRPGGSAANGSDFHYPSWFSTRPGADTLPVDVVLPDGGGGIPAINIQGPAASASQVVGFVVEHAQNTPAVYISSASPTIRGNLIRENRGGAIFIEGSSSKALIVGNRFLDNGYVYAGAAIAMLGGAADIIGNDFERNRAFIGGAVFGDGEMSHAMSDNTFIGNFASAGGGAVYFYAGGPLNITRNLFVADTSDHAGAVANSDRDSLSVIRNTFDRCVAGLGQGGGAACWWARGALYGGQILGNIITNSISLNGGGGAIGCDPENVGYLSVDYNCVFNNQPTDYFRQPSGPNSLSADPMECDPSSMDYQLHAQSLCVGSGIGGEDRGAFGIGCPQIEVQIDIMPGVCPNEIQLFPGIPIEVEVAKALPDIPEFKVAVLGDGVQDLHALNPAGFLLSGHAPKGWRWADVSAPLAIRESGDCECPPGQPDGHTDLVLTFDQEEIIQTWGAPAVGGSHHLALSEIAKNVGVVTGVDCLTLTSGPGIAPAKPMVVKSEKHLRRAAPNPFNASTLLEYELSETANVSLRVYDLLGRPVRTLVLAYQSAGTYQHVWDGRNDHSESVASGVYFAQLVVDGAPETVKMVLLK